MEFDADRPIGTEEEDRLERRPFAESIAKQILAIPVEQGFTVAVAGEWGSGKTSILNMIAGQLESDPQPLVVVWFNPWLFRGAEDLLPRFFAELSAQLGRNRRDSIKRVARALADIGEASSPLIPLPWVAPVSSLLVQGTKHWTGPSSLLAQLEQLKAALTKSESRIVIIIDDIDRLEQGETRELMRLIRLVSDLPNAVFLLAFDRDRVAQSLDREIGQSYLEKIVQLTYDIPSVRRNVLQRFFLDGLQELIEEHRLDPPDEQQWAPVLFEIVQPLLRNLRDVKRLLYSLPATLRIIGNEIAVSDLVGLEAIRVFRPKIFETLRVHSSDLTGVSGTIRRDVLKMKSQEEIGNTIRNMVKEAKEDGELLESVITTLFPAARGFLEGQPQRAFSSGALRARRRVGDEEVFRTYLQFGLDKGVIPAKEIREFVDSLEDEPRFKSKLESLDEQQLETVLERLEDFGRDFSEGAILSAVPVIANQLGRLSPHARRMLEPSPQMQARGVLIRLLRASSGQETLEAMMDELIKKVDSLSSRLTLIHMAGYREDAGRQLITEGKAEDLERMVERDLEKATSASLSEEWDLASLVRRTLSRLDGEDKTNLASRLRQHLSDNAFVLRLLSSSVNVAFIDYVPEKRLFWDGLVTDLGDEFPEAVARVVESSKTLELDAENHEVVQLAQKYLDGWRPRDIDEQ